MKHIIIKRQQGRTFFLQICALFAAFLFVSFHSFAQEVNTDEDRVVRSTFESTLLIDNQTVMVPYKGTF